MVFSVDRLFFPERLSLISAYITIIVQNHKLGIAELISLVTLLYRHIYAAELCGSLAIYFIIEYIIIKYSVSIIENF